eukprot:2418610-Rhodomonas_salina.1
MLRCPFATITHQSSEGFFLCGVRGCCVITSCISCCGAACMVMHAPFVLQTALLDFPDCDKHSKCLTTTVALQDHARHPFPVYFN